MDDILVNFDPRRATATTRVLNDVAAKRQVILFTCHPETVDLLKKNAEAAVFAIENNRIARMSCP